MQFLKFLHRKNASQAEFADKMGYSKTLIQAWVSGRATPSYDKIIELVNEGISANELFNEDVALRLLQNSQKIEYENINENLKEEIIREICNRLSRVN